MHHTIPSLGSFRADAPSGLQQQSTLVLAEHGGLAARFWTKAETTEPCFGSPVPPGRDFFFAICPWVSEFGSRIERLRSIFQTASVRDLLNSPNATLNYLCVFFR
jgi:hypothetical protein